MCKLVNNFYELKWVEYSWPYIILQFAPHALCFLLVSHTCAFCVRPHGAEIKYSSGADPKECGGPQASSGEDTNITLDQGKPQCI
jgi:hypothetical protein